MFLSPLRALAVLAAAGLALAHASPFPSNETSHLVERQGLAQVITSCVAPDAVALTFDDGPYLYMIDIAVKLQSVGGKATFFVNGNNWNCIYSAYNLKRLKYVYYQGHQVASHTWSHTDLTTLSWDQINDEMARVDLALVRILGVTPAFMRPPYGAYNDNVRAVAASRGQKLVMWDFDSGDSLGHSVEQCNQDYTDLANRRPPNVLTLNHETLETTAHQVLPHAIDVLSAKGYRFVTVAECLGMPAYQSIVPTQIGKWSCN